MCRFHFLYLLCFFFHFLLQWLSPRLMILYRAILAVYTTSWSIAGGFLRLDQGAKWFIFLTNWSYTFLNIHFIMGTILPIYYHIKIKKTVSCLNNGDDHESGYDCKASTDHHSGQYLQVIDVSKRFPYFQVACKASWVIYNIAAGVGPVITVAYWSAVYTPGKRVDGADVDAHAINSVMIIVDTLMCSIPVRLLHVVYPMLLMITYALFSVIYWKSGGTNPFGQPYIYAVLDYQNHPTVAAITIVSIFFIALPLSQSFLYCLFRFRCWLKNRKAHPETKSTF